MLMTARIPCLQDILKKTKAPLIEHSKVFSFLKHSFPPLKDAFHSNGLLNRTTQSPSNLDLQLIHSHSVLIMPMPTFDLQNVRKYNLFIALKYIIHAYPSGRGSIHFVTTKSTTVAHFRLTEDANTLSSYKSR